MKDYEKPIVVANEDAFEGVYAASGGLAENDCWTVDVRSEQDWNGSHHVFQVHAVHSTAVKHISTSTTVTLTFSSALTNAYSEFSCTCSGNTVTVTRELLANGYGSGDNYTYKVWASTGNEATTKALTCTGASISGVKTANVQGELD